MHLAYTPEANTLLADDPLSLLIGMLLDQQIPMEKAFTSPYELRQRLGGKLDAATIAGYDPAAFEELFRTPPALHRFPAAMARRVQELARVIADEYGGDASALWSGVSSGDELTARLAKLPGFGAQKAAIFTALLDNHGSVADLTQGAVLRREQPDAVQQRRRHSGSPAIPSHLALAAAFTCCL